MSAPHEPHEHGATQTSAHVSRETSEFDTPIGAAAERAMQVLHTGNARQVAEARKILNGARRSLYRLLAEDDEEKSGTGDAGRA